MARWIVLGCLLTLAVLSAVEVGSRLRRRPAPAEPVPAAPDPWIEGRVLLEDGTPVPGAGVWYGKAGLPYGDHEEVLTDDRGRYRIECPERGPYHVDCYLDSGGACQSSVERGAKGVDFMIRGRVLEVTLLDENGARIEREARLCWRRTADESGLSCPPAWSSVGRCQLAAQPGEELILSVTVDPNCRYGFGGVSLAQVVAAVTLHAGVGIQRMNLVVPPFPPCGALAVRVRWHDGRPLERVFVNLVNDAGDGPQDLAPWEEIDLDGEGAGRLDGVPPGEFRATLSPYEFGGEIPGPVGPEAPVAPGTARYDLGVNVVVRVTVRSAETTRLEATIPLGGRLILTALDLSGRVVPAFARLRDADGRPARDTFAGVEDGRTDTWNHPQALHSGPLLPGRYRVEILDGDGGVKASGEVEIRAGEISYCEITVPR